METKLNNLNIEGNLFQFRDYRDSMVNTSEIHSVRRLINSKLLSIKFVNLPTSIEAINRIVNMEDDKFSVFADIQGELK